MVRDFYPGSGFFFMPDPVDLGVKKFSIPYPYPQHWPQQWPGRIWIRKKYLRIRKNCFQIMSEEEFPNFDPFQLNLLVSKCPRA
jgi:hypothetical protein